MGNACQPFGFSIDDGMKAFCVAEMCVGIFHLIIASWAYDGFDSLHALKKVSDASKLDFPFSQFLTMAVLIIFVITLIGQFVCGLLLYFLGYKQRNVTICWVWIGVACVNFTIPWIVMLCQLAYYTCDGCKASVGIWSRVFLYLLYIIFGVWIVYVYIKWAKSTGIAVQYSSTPASGTAPSQSQRSAKVANQDNGA